MSANCLNPTMMKKLSILFLIPLISINLFAGEKTIYLSQQQTDFVLTARAFEGFTFHSSIESLKLSSQWAAESEYTVLEVPGYIKDFSQSGNPELPVLSRLIEVPEGASVNVEVLQKKTSIVRLQDQGFMQVLYPSQPSVSKSTDPDKVAFVKNTAAYALDAFNDQKLIRVEMIGRMRGVRIARLIYSPFRYNPVSNVLEITEDVDARISFPGADYQLSKETKSRYYSPAFETTFNALANHGPESINDTLNHLPMKFVIVSDPMFQSALQPFVAWKKKKGFDVIEAYTNNPAVGTTTTSIKTYLQALYNSATYSDPAPSYVLLVGDVNQVPSFAGTSGSHPTDLYYFEYDGGGDYLPELYYGRFSANNLTELQPQLDKTLQYEKYQMPGTAYLAEVVMVAGMDASYGPTHGNGQINYGTSLYFNSAHSLNSSTYLYPVSGSSASQIIAKISDGVGFANYTAHCGTNGWSDPSFSISDISSLQNINEYPLMIGNCCLAVKFDGNCFGEEIVRAAGKGALGYIGGSNSTYWDEDFYWSVGVGTPAANPSYAGTSLGAYDRVFHDQGEPHNEWYETNGQIVAAGNLAVSASSSSSDKYYWEIYHLMGDPTVMTYFGVPSALSATYPAMIPVGYGNLSITTEPYAYVGVSRNGILHGAGFADSLGNLPLSITPFLTPGYFSIVISKQNRQPLIDSIMVIVPNGAFVGVNGYVTNDYPGGNNNGKVDFGESILLDLALENYGNIDATMLTASITSNDPLITLTDSLEIFNLISAGDTSIINGAFAFDVAGFVPDQHPVSLALQLMDTSGGIWSYNLNLLLNAPQIIITEMDVDDAMYGNGDGTIDPGESVEIIATIKNTGHSDAVAPTASLITYSPIASVSIGSAILNTLTPGNQQTVNFQVAISSGALVGDVFEVHCTAGSGLYQDLKIFAPMVGSIVEDWETGNFNRFPWTQGGSQAWTISTTSPYEGSYCAASGNIGNSSTSTLEVDVNVLMNDYISFYRKVSSESNYDFLIFSIDGVSVDEWSGNQSWAQESYPIGPGLHTFRWSYEKDWSSIGGSDKAWIDYIDFPAVAGIATGEEEKELSTRLNVFPNPTNASAEVSLFLPGTEDVRLILMDETGRKVMDVHTGLLLQGYHRFTITDAMAGGVYYLLLSAGDFQLNKKLIILR